MMSGLLLDGSDHSMLPERGYTSDCISTHAQAISIVKFEVDRYKQQGKPPPVEVITDVFIRYVRGKRAKGHPPSRIALKLSDLVSSIKGRNLYWEDPATLDKALHRTLTCENLNTGLNPPTSGQYSIHLPRPPGSDVHRPSLGVEQGGGDAPPAYQAGWEMEAALRESARVART